MFEDQLNNLLNTLNRTSAHFIRCIIPNLDRKPGIVNGPLVLHQLRLITISNESIIKYSIYRCNGVLEGIRICRRGYPNRLIFRDFVSRYSLLVPSSCSSDNNDDDNQRKSAEQLCNRIGLVPITEYQLGVTKVFFRVGLIGELENRRNQRLAEFVTGIQAHIRSYLVSINYEYRYNRWYM
jgi:myosin heavy subunit